MDVNSPVYDCVCFKTRLAARRITAFYEARLAPHGLGLPQFSLLAQTHATPDAPIAEIAEALELDPSTLSRTLRPLEDQGLIEIVLDESNRRLRRVRLTRAGKARLRDAAPAWTKANKDAAALVNRNAIELLCEASGRLPA